MEPKREREKKRERARRTKRQKNGAHNATKKMFQDTPSSRRAYASPDNASPRRGRKVRFFRRGGKGTGGCVVRGDGEKSSEINRRESRREGIRRNRTVGHVGGMPRDTGVA